MSVAEILSVIQTLDRSGRWISVYDGEKLVGQPKFRMGDRYLSSEVFARNIRLLTEAVSPATHE